MSDARSLLRAKRAATETRISHPYASYTSSNQLKCTICNSVIKHASAWEGHLGSKAHRVGVAKVRAEQEAAAQRQQQEVARIRVEEEERVREEREQELDVQRRQRDEQEAERAAGSKRKAEEDSSMASPDAAKSKGKTKKVKLEESSSTKAGFPADFFSDPSRSIPAFTNDSDDEEDAEGEGGGEAMAVDAPAKTAIDDEFEMFQREMLASAPQTRDKADLYAQATVAAEAELFTEEHISGGFARPSTTQAGDAAEVTEAAVIPMTEEEKAEAKRKQREEDDRELIMDRLLEEERIQEEADMRVQAMKNRMEALKKKREARKAAAGAKGQS
ncbi:hypothetical protein BKA70DRAFT_717462 [Coprinopsis sp. MPI-PUGE-AT-0042]|nr:hypothetical protein BKA70DRAFT_717462 [Coprinopsis sp. MPI-PUGE-AT-0042]